MFWLYILKSIIKERTYIGITANVEKRLLEHNRGNVRSTKAFIPWRLVYTESFSSKLGARKYELRLKKHSASKEELYKRIGLINSSKSKDPLRSRLSAQTL